MRGWLQILFLTIFMLSQRVAADELYVLELKSMELSAALSTLGQITNIQIFYPQDLVDGVQSNALSGRYSLRKAVELLLKNTPVHYRFIDTNTLALQSLRSHAVGREEVIRTRQLEAKNDDARHTAVDEIIVSAQKRDENIHDVPMAVSVVSARDSAYTFGRDLRDMTYAAPNTLIERGNANTVSLSIRGVSLSDLEKSFDPAVGIMVDDVYLASISAGLVDTFDVKRMEVLRGPQGTLQGKNTAGGLLKIVRNRPVNVFQAELSAAFKSDNAMDIRGMVNLPVSEELLNIRASIIQRRGGAYIRNVLTGYNQGNANFLGATLAFDLTPTSDISAYYALTMNRDDSDHIPFVNSSPADSGLCIEFGQCDFTLSGEREINSPEKQPTFFYDDLHILQLQWDLGRSMLTSVTGYRDLNEDVRVDYDTSVADYHLSDRPASDLALSEELRIQSTFSGRFDYVAGLFFWDREYTINQLTHQLFGLPFYRSGGRQLTETTQKSRSWALFAQADIEVSGKLSLTLGGRFTEEKKWTRGAHYYLDAQGVSVESPSDSTPIPGGDAASTTIGEKKWERFTPKVALRYATDQSSMLYVSYTEGFRSGGYNGRARRQAALGPYKPEILRSFELGYRAQWWGGRLSLRPTLFYTRYLDKQEEFATYTGAEAFTVVKNASSAELLGAEVELSYQGPRLDFSASYGYLESKYIEYTFLNSRGELTDKSDNRLLLAPRNTFGLSSRYHLALNHSGLELVPALNIKYRDSYQTSGDDPVHGVTGSYIIIDGSISLEAEAWRLSLFGRNLGNTTYRPFTKNVISSQTQENLWSFSTVNRPRRFGIELEFQF